MRTSIESFCFFFSNVFVGKCAESHDQYFLVLELLSFVKVNRENFSISIKFERFSIMNYTILLKFHIETRETTIRNYRVLNVITEDPKSIKTEILFWLLKRNEIQERKSYWPGHHNYFLSEIEEESEFYFNTKNIADGKLFSFIFTWINNYLFGYIK